jgi:hypothetical protein
MPLATRGRQRDLLRAVPVTDTLYYSFKTTDLSAIAGVSESDITALGQIAITAVPSGKIVVLSPRSPKPAQFRKNLSGGTQGSVSAYGNGLTAQAVNTAAGAGWQQTRGIRRCSFGSTPKSTAVAVEVSNGLLVKRMIPITDAQTYATALGLKTTLSEAELKKLVFAPQSANPTILTRPRPGGTGSITLPCSKNEVAAAISSTGGWKELKPESGFAPAAAPPASGGTGG